MERRTIPKEEGRKERKEEAEWRRGGLRKCRVWEKGGQGVCVGISQGPFQPPPPPPRCACGFHPDLWHQPEKSGTVMSNLLTHKGRQGFYMPLPLHRSFPAAL